MSVEPRQSIRWKKPIGVVLRLNGGTLPSRFRDIGMGGAYVEVDGAALAPAVPVEIRLRLPH